MIDIKEIAKTCGIYFHDAGHAPIEHTLNNEYSEICFDRLARAIIRECIEEINLGYFETPIESWQENRNTGIEYARDALMEMSNDIAKDIDQKLRK